MQLRLLSAEASELAVADTSCWLGCRAISQRTML